MKKKDLTNINVSDLRAQIAKAQMEIVTRKAKNTNAAKNLKRTLAQKLTELNISKK